MATSQMIFRLLLFVALLLSRSASTPVSRLPALTNDRVFRAALDEGRQKCPVRPAGHVKAQARLHRRAKDTVKLPKWIQTQKEVTIFLYGMAVSDCMCLKLNEWVADGKEFDENDVDGMAALRVTWLDTCIDEIQMYSRQMGEAEEREMPGWMIPQPRARVVPPERRPAPETPGGGGLFDGGDQDGRPFSMSLGGPGGWKQQAGVLMNNAGSTINQVVENAKGFQWSSAAAALGRVKVPVPALPARAPIPVI